MENFTLYFKIVNYPVPLKKVVTINVNEDTMSVYGLLDIANLHLSNVVVLAGVQMPDNVGNMGFKTIPMRLSKVEVWEYMEKYGCYVGIIDILNNPLPVELKGIAILKGEKQK